MPQYTVVQFYGEQRTYSCGYCKSGEGRNDYGMWLYNVLPEDYQDLIDRGWRRCGSYCYKPALKNDCCPMYTIRCPVSELKLTKSQKKTIKRLNNYIITGDKAKGKNTAVHDQNNVPVHDINEDKMPEDNLMQNLATCSDTVVYMKDDVKKPNKPYTAAQKECVITGTGSSLAERKYSYSNLLQADPTMQRKARFKRLERRRQKLLAKGLSDDEIAKCFNKKINDPVVKSLEQFLDDYKDKKCALDFQVNLVPVSDTVTYKQYIEEEFELYKKYQLIIHKEDERKNSIDGYRRFLVTSSLEAEEIKFDKTPINAPVYRYGLYHQHYRIHGKLIAVGVIDILPACVSSVYFFYDPTYSHLKLGTYSSLREIALVRELSCYSSDLCYYYMGFYIHSCQKVRYKANIKPSYLLCPETYTWIPAVLCQQKLDHVKYCRFNDDLNAVDTNYCDDISETLVLYKRRIMTYSEYTNAATNDKTFNVGKLSEIKLYSELIGRKCANKIILYVE